MAESESGRNYADKQAAAAGGPFGRDSTSGGGRSVAGSERRDYPYPYIFGAVGEDPNACC